MNALNPIQFLSVIYDKSTALIKMLVLIENKSRAAMQVDTGSGSSAVPIKVFRKDFQNYKIFPQDVQLKTGTDEIFKPLAYVKVNVSYVNKPKNVRLF